MSKLIEGEGNFKGGYFVINKEASQYDYLGGDGFIVTCKKQKDLLALITDLISNAKTYIKVCSFIIDNKQIFDLLMEQLRKRNLSVFILTAIDERNIKSDILNEIESEEFSALRHFEFIGELVKAGGHIRASPSAHAKFLIQDGNKAIIMSANLTEPSLIMNQGKMDPNYESGILLENKSEVTTLERIFDSIFQYGTKFKRFIEFSKDIQLIDIKDIDINEADFPPMNTPILWSYEEYHQLLYDKMILTIAQGMSQINLSTFSIVGLRNLNEFIQEVKSFIIDRNGAVNIYCRAMNHRFDHISACLQLSDLGVKIYGDMFNHSKGISVDDKEGIIFTANIDGKHGLKSGFEIGYHLNNSHRSFSKFNSFMKYQLETAPFVFKSEPYKKDVFDFYKYWYKEKNVKKEDFPLKFEVTYFKNKQFVSEFEDLISNVLIFYSILKDSEPYKVQFELKDKAYLLRKINSVTFEVEKEIKGNDIYKGEKYVLFYESINLVAI